MREISSLLAYRLPGLIFINHDIDPPTDVVDINHAQLRHHCNPDASPNGFLKGGLQISDLSMSRLGTSGYGVPPVDLLFHSTRSWCALRSREPAPQHYEFSSQRYIKCYYH
jgi:hypothetical protein